MTPRWKAWRDLLNRFRRERIFFIAAALFVILFLSSAGVYTLERHEAGGDIHGFGDALWWSLVTVTTVGYGDTVPRTAWGRVVAMATMFSGIFLFSITTATIASEFVEKKIRGEKGLEAVKLKGHVVICGWNEFAEEIIDGLIRECEGKQLKIVLVNELPQEEVDGLREKYEGTEVDFVRGDFVYEHVLKRASISSALGVIVVADTSAGKPLEHVDERTILATLAIKSLAPHTRTCGELLEGSNRPHLIRANVDEVIVRGEKTGLLLASATLSPGLSSVLEGILALDSENRLWRMEVPERFAGSSARDLRQYLRQEHAALLIAIVRETKGINLADLLSHDMTAVDAFIQKKFQEAQIPLVRKGGGYGVTVNPPDDYPIEHQDAVFVLGPRSA